MPPLSPVNMRSLIALAVLLAAVAAIGAAPAAKAPGAGKVGEKCIKGDACVTGICSNGTCVSREAACKAAAQLPQAGCVGNYSAASGTGTAAFSKVVCDDFADKVATTLQLAKGLGSTINSTTCYTNGFATCVVLQDSAALVNYGAMCRPQTSGAGRAVAGGAAAALAAMLAAAAALL